MMASSDTEKGMAVNTEHMASLSLGSEQLQILDATSEKSINDEQIAIDSHNSHLASQDAGEIEEIDRTEPPALTLYTLPADIHLVLFDILDEAASTLLGLTCKKFYMMHFAANGVVRLDVESSPYTDNVSYDKPYEIEQDKLGFILEEWFPKEPRLWYCECHNIFRPKRLVKEAREPVEDYSNMTWEEYHITQMKIGNWVQKMDETWYWEYYSEYEHRFSDTEDEEERHRLKREQEEKNLKEVEDEFMAATKADEESGENGGWAKLIIGEDNSDSKKGENYEDVIERVKAEQDDGDGYDADIDGEDN